MYRRHFFSNYGCWIIFVIILIISIGNANGGDILFLYSALYTLVVSMPTLSLITTRNIPTKIVSHNNFWVVMQLVVFFGVMVEKVVA